VLDSHLGALAFAPLAEQTRRTYASKAPQYVGRLAGAELDGDPLGSDDARDWAVPRLSRPPAGGAQAQARDHQQRARGHRRPLHPLAASARPTQKRVEIPDAAPRALGKKAQVRYLRAAHASPSLTR
jgi:hypothetical protein